MMNNKILILIAACMSVINAFSQIQISNEATINSFPLVCQGEPTPLYVSPSEDLAVKKVADLFVQDLENVTTVKGNVKYANIIKDKRAIVLATIGKNKWVDRLIKSKKIDVSSIKNGWEQYMIVTLDEPQQGVEQTLLVLGSDKRGAAYGLLSISENMGVSPFYWWADIPVKHMQEVYLTGKYTSRQPTVKYRGLFINDEDWGLKPWSSKNFEKELGDIGPRTYSKVCELILRLKGNMLGPAMHSCTGAFYSHPESKLVADSFGIVITTSHCEPILVNTASKWEFDVKRDGDWNYKTNAKTVYNKWDNRLKEASLYENIYTMGMRGLHDAGLRGELPLNEQTTLLNRVIADQRVLLKKHLKKNIKDIPQIFVPYKETMDLYENGLSVPEDVTLVWVDDNYGYMKRVSSPAEQGRKGGSGVYYHLSYLGAPHDYLWLNTTPPVLMYEELMKAYHTGANQYWLLNVGDIKPMELGMATFFDLAWNVNEYDIQKINQHQSKFLGSIYGQAYINRFQSLLDSYYQLAWSRKPEFMGWEREWDSKEYTGLKDTEYSYSNYSEAQSRLHDYNQLSNEVKNILDEMPPSLKPSFFEMVAYPAMASYQMNRKFLMAQLNHEMAEKGNMESANWAARQTKEAFDSIAALNARYNTMLNGKWNGMIDLAPGWCALYQNMPAVSIDEKKGETPVDLTVVKEKAENCHVIDLAQYKQKVEQNGHSITLVDGIGYDWRVVQLGKPTEQTADITANGDRIEYEIPSVSKDSIEVVLHTVPFFPLYKGNGTRVGVSVDGSEPQVFNNEFKEYGLSWKNQVLRNGAVAHMRFAIDKTKKKHVISLICGDSGMMVQKVIINWGGLKKSYLGPQS